MSNAPRAEEANAPLDPATELKTELILYRAEDGRIKLDVRLQADTVWLSLNQMADLFQRDNSVISKHITNLFEEGELTPEPTVAKFATVQKEGNREVSREIEFYNLDVIISDTTKDFEKRLEDAQEYYRTHDVSLQEAA